MTKEEAELIWTAQYDRDEQKANDAMKQLKEKYDETYGFCNDCDGLVVKESECCMNIVIESNDLF